MSINPGDTLVESNHVLRITHGNVMPPQTFLNARSVPRLGFNGMTCWQPLGSGYRAYSPVLMRFHAADSVSPFGRGGINAYAYGGGDPQNKVDPSGHFPMALFAPVALTLAAGAIAGAAVIDNKAGKAVLGAIAIAAGIGALGAIRVGGQSVFGHLRDRLARTGSQKKSAPLTQQHLATHDRHFVGPAKGTTTDAWVVEQNTPTGQIPRTSLGGVQRPSGQQRPASTTSIRSSSISSDGTGISAGQLRTLDTPGAGLRWLEFNAGKPANPVNRLRIVQIRRGLVSSTRAVE